MGKRSRTVGPIFKSETLCALLLPPVFFACSTALTAPLPALAQQTISGQSAQAAQVTPQESSWIQIEAQSTLLGAQDRIRDYGQAFPNVAGFDLGSGWYGILLGPYTAEDARAALRQLRRDGLVPRDSFVQFSSRLQQQFFPIGAQFSETAPAAPATNAQVKEPTPTQEPAVTPTVETGELSPIPQIYVPDETRAEAQRSERLLSRDEKKNYNAR